VGKGLKSSDLREKAVNFNIERRKMLVEIAKPVSFIFCILSLYSVFHTAFLVPASDLHQRIYDSLAVLALSAAISFLSGLSFRATEPEPQNSQLRLTATLPVKLFFWGAGAMFVLFVVSWYLETYCVFYRDIRF
jgi:hypothetical protein